MSLTGVTESGPSHGPVIEGYTYVGLRVLEEWGTTASGIKQIRIYGGPRTNGTSGGWLVDLAKGEQVVMVLTKMGPENRAIPTVGPQRVFHRNGNGKYTNGILFKEGVEATELKRLMMVSSSQGDVPLSVELE